VTIEIHGPREIAKLRRAGEAAAATLAAVGARLRAGVTTAEIDGWVREHTKQLGGRPSQLGYNGFPATVCTSRNEVVCHGIPRRTEILQTGDIINVDVTTNLDGFHGDTSATFVIGEASREARHVVEACSASWGQEEGNKTRREKPPQMWEVWTGSPAGHADNPAHTGWEPSGPKGRFLPWLGRAAQRQSFRLSFC